MLCLWLTLHCMSTLDMEICIWLTGKTCKDIKFHFVIWSLASDFIHTCQIWSFFPRLVSAISPLSEHWNWPLKGTSFNALLHFLQVHLCVRRYVVIYMLLMLHFWNQMKYTINIFSLLHIKHETSLMKIFPFPENLIEHLKVVLLY